MPKPTKVCEFPECGRPHSGYGLCQTHRKHQIQGIELAPIKDRAYGDIESRLKAHSTRVGECDIWGGSKNKKGYGTMKDPRIGTSALAHRVAYEVNYGPIPAGREIDHRCLNRACIRPEHLQVATRKINMENLSGAQGGNVTGIRGVTVAGNKFRARVIHNKKPFSAGFFDDVHEAERAVIALRKKLFSNNLRDRQEVQHERV